MPVRETIQQEADEATFRRLMDSEHMKQLRAEYDAHFGPVSERARFAYTQVWP